MSGSDPTAPAPTVDGTRDAAPACPGCRAPMRLRMVEPVLRAGEFDDMTYRCEGCGTEVKRTVKRR